jgi:hypothetical protein
VFTARYALSPYIKQIRFVFKGLIHVTVLFFPLHTAPQWARGPSLSRIHDHTQTHTTLGRTPLDK